MSTAQTWSEIQKNVHHVLRCNLVDTMVVLGPWRQAAGRLLEVRAKRRQFSAEWDDKSMARACSMKRWTGRTWISRLRKLVWKSSMVWCRRSGRGRQSFSRIVSIAVAEKEKKQESNWWKDYHGNDFESLKLKMFIIFVEFELWRWQPWTHIIRSV